MLNDSQTIYISIQNTEIVDIISLHDRLNKIQ